MGLIRKAMSVSTLGVVNFKSNKEKARKNEKRAAKAAEKQAEAFMLMAKAQERAAGKDD